MLTELLAGYAAQGDRYDGAARGAQGAPRPHWDAFMRSLAERGEREVERHALADRARRSASSGITYNVYEDAMGARPARGRSTRFRCCCRPRSGERIEAGIEQRADLLNRVLGDIYGPQELMKSGAIPPPVVFGHQRLPRAGAGAEAGERHAPVPVRRRPGALARRPLVGGERPDAGALGLGLRAREPAGGLARLPADVPRAAGAAPRRRTSTRCARRCCAGRRAATAAARIVLAHARAVQRDLLRARAAGALPRLRAGRGQRPDGAQRPGLAEDDRAGLQRVHAIVRRQDDDYCDPLELRSDSALGIAGLTECARRGTCCSPTRSARACSNRARCSATLPKLARAPAR